PSSLAELGEYPEKVNAAVSDHFAMRPAMISINNRLRLALFGETPTEQTIFGPTGRLFFTSHLAAAPYSLIRLICGIGISDVQVKAVADSTRFASVMAERHVNGIIVLVPTAPVIYRNELPRWLRNRCRGLSTVERMIGQLAKSGRENRFVYPLQPMLAAAKS